MAKPTGKLIRMTPELVGALPVAGTAEAAKKLAVAVTINGVTFDGSKAITLTAANIGALTDTQAAQKYALRSIKINGQALSADVNLLAGDVNAWNKTEADGRYLLKAATAVAATKLATARKINGVDFDGTKDITLKAESIGAVSANAKQLCTAWVCFSGVNTISIRDSHNVSSVVRESNGIYTINFTVPMKSANYAVIPGIGDGAYTGNGGITLLINGSSGTGEAIKKDIYGVRLIVRGSAGPFDASQCSVAIFGGNV